MSLAHLRHGNESLRAIPLEVESRHLPEATIRSRARVRWLFGLALLVALMSGCASGSFPITIYDEARAKRSAQVVTDLKAVNTAEVIAAHQKNLNALRDEELATQDSVAQTSRAFVLRGLVGSTMGAWSSPNANLPRLPTGLSSRIDDALQNDLLGMQQPTKDPQGIITVTHQGATFDQIDRGVAALEEWRQARDAENVLFVSYDIVFKTYKMPGPPRCADLLPPKNPGDPPAYSPRVQLALDSLAPRARILVEPALEAMRADACNGAAANEFDITANFGTLGALPVAVKQYQHALVEQATAEKAANAAQQAYATSKAKYEQAVRDAGGSTAAADVEKASKQLEANIKQLEDLANLTKSLTSKFLSAERLKSLDEFVSTVNTNVAAGTVPKGTPKAATAAILLTGLVADAQKTLADGKTPLNLPLMIRRDQEQLKSDAATLQVASWKAQIELKKQLVATLTDEVVALTRARRELAQAAAAEGMSADAFGKLKFTEAVGKSSMSRMVKSATLRYLTVLGRLEADRHKLEYKVIDAQYAEGLAQDALALKRWESLVTLTSGQVAEYYENATIKPSTVVDVLQLLMLGWIGHGVNK